MLHLLRTELCYLQSEAESQVNELLSQSQTQLPAEGQDEGEMQRELRDLSEHLIERQQQLMTAQAALTKAQETQIDAERAWEAKKCVMLFVLKCY